MCCLSARVETAPSDWDSSDDQMTKSQETVGGRISEKDIYSEVVGWFFFFPWIKLKNAPFWENSSVLMQLRISPLVVLSSDCRSIRRWFEASDDVIVVVLTLCFRPLGWLFHFNETSFYFLFHSLSSVVSPFSCFVFCFVSAPPT